MDVAEVSNETDWLDLVRRIMAADTAAETELVRRYQGGIRVIIGRLVRDQLTTEELSQETFRIILEKVRAGHLRDAERLSGFICAVARNVAIEYLRKRQRLTNQEGVGGAEQVSDPQPDPYEQLWRKEKAALVRRVIGELKAERDRQVLSRFYIAEEEKEQICADLGLSSQQFNSVLFRALKRYKELYTRQVGKG